jgi:hypothetical protein
MGVRNETVLKRTGPPGPEPAGAWGRAWFRASQPFAEAWGRGRGWWLLARGERKVRHWWRPRTWPANIVYTALFLVYVLWIVYSFWPGGPWRYTLRPVADWLEARGWQQALSALGLSAATVVAAVWFVVWRFRRTRRRYLHKARTHPDELVKPGTIIGEVVGRDRLCDSLIDDLRDRGQRRPRVIVGSIGVGKTALLVHLTGRLARKGITPVVLQLRDVTDSGFDFAKLAKEKFCDESLRWVYSEAEAEKVWQRLRHTHDRVVVLADGLEDALKGVQDRDTKIRKAIADAHEAKLPLVVTSRPQKSLQSIVAAQTVLDPLSEEDALQYVSRGSNWRTDKLRMDWVVEAANVAESPLYLNIAKDLELRGLLERIVGGGADENSDPRDQDVWALRYDLLEAWIKALYEGHLYPEQPLSNSGRRMTVEWLSALACAALRSNSTFVRYEVLTRQPTDCGSHDGDGSGDRQAGLVRKRLTDHLWQELDKVRSASGIDARLAGSWGSRLGLVEERDDGVRFHHSVLQAFLASRYMGPLIHSEPARDAPAPESRDLLAAAGPQGARRPGTATGSPLHDPTDEEVRAAYFDTALKCPGRELGLALVFYSRSEAALTAYPGEHGPVTPDRDGDWPIDIVQSRLRDSASGALPAGPAKPGGATDSASVTSGDVEQDPRIRALEMYSAALDVDSFHHRPAHRQIVQDIRDHWESLEAYNDRALDAPKKALIRRIGATGRLLSSRRALPPCGTEAIRDSTAYSLLFDIACQEPSHAVGFTIAEAIGEGGDDAFCQLVTRLSALAAGRDAPQDGEASGTSQGGERIDTFRGGPRGPAAPTPERPVSAPGTTQTERLLRRARTVILDSHRRAEEVRELDERRRRERARRAEVLSAWLAPMLVQSCSYTRHERTPYEVLSQWMKRVAEHNIDLDVQVALAQGFRRAANRRTPPTEPTTTRDFLMEQAWEMLRHTRYWYARLVLVHALTLWALPDDIAQPRPRHGHGARPARQVRQWLERSNACDHERTGQQEHPLVKAAGAMALRALQSRRPDRFLWIDETGMASQIGSETNSPREPRLHNLWIPPSRGWSTLDPGAQQLLGDVLVLLTLTEERGDRPEDARLRLKHADRADPPLLPPCLARDRAPLVPARALPTEASHSLPGSNCADGCPFELCPYPPKGPQCRTELNEAFCIHQRSMLNRMQFQAWRFLRFRRRAPWQRDVSVASLRKFWNDMGDRARNADVREASRRHLDRP